MEFEVTATVVFRVSYTADLQSAVNRVRTLLPRRDGDLPETVKIVRVVAIAPRDEGSTENYTKF